MKKFISKVSQKLDDSSSSAPSASSAGPSILTHSTPPSQREFYLYRQQRGVNLGSVFALEQWLTPSVFEAASDPKKSEFDVVKGENQDRVKERLENHWNMIDDGDWQWMAGHGINTVRLPIAYYHFLSGTSHSSLMKGTPYEKYASIYSGAWDKITALIQKAGSMGIGVLVDLHAAPGAQNEDAHCSHSDGKAGLWDSSSLQKKTIEILVALAQAVSQFPNVVGLELLNEPKNGSHLQAFYDKAIPAIRNSGVKELPLYVGDGWTTEHYCNWLSNYKDDFVVVDYHLYRCFTPEDHKTASEVHAQNTREGGSTFNWLKSMAEKANQGNLIVGEWSAALNPGSFEASQKVGPNGGKLEARKEWARSQLEAFSKLTGGNFFWTLKKEGQSDPGWCFYTSLEKGCLPESLDPRKTLNIKTEDLENRGRDVGNKALESHSNYWNNHGNQGDHKAFKDGWDLTWNDCLEFWKNGHELGFHGQWARMRANGFQGPKEQKWEFEHGATQAGQEFKRAVSGG